MRETWRAPEIEVTVGGTTRIATVQRMEVLAARGAPIASLFLELSNVRFEWQGVVKARDPLSVAWGYRGQLLDPIFTGTVLRSHTQETCRIWAVCRGRALIDTRITRTYREETAAAVVRHLVGTCGFVSLDIAECSAVIDKLPLQETTIAQAIRLLQRRLDLPHACYTDPQGTFHWNTENLAQAPAATFTLGEDVSRYVAVPGGRVLLTVTGCSLWHSQVVSLTDRDGTEKRLFIDQIKHTVGIDGAGARTHLWTREVAGG